MKQHQGDASTNSSCIKAAFISPQSSQQTSNLRLEPSLFNGSLPQRIHQSTGKLAKFTPHSAASQASRQFANLLQQSNQSSSFSIQKALKLPSLNTSAIHRTNDNINKSSSILCLSPSSSQAMPQQFRSSIQPIPSEMEQNRDCYYLQAKNQAWRDRKQAWLASLEGCLHSDCIDYKEMYLKHFQSRVPVKKESTLKRKQQKGNNGSFKSNNNSSVHRGNSCDQDKLPSQSGHQAEKNSNNGSDPDDNHPESQKSNNFQETQRGDNAESQRSQLKQSYAISGDTPKTSQKENNAINSMDGMLLSSQQLRVDSQGNLSEMNVESQRTSQRQQQQDQQSYIDSQRTEGKQLSSSQQNEDVLDNQNQSNIEEPNNLDESPARKDNLNGQATSSSGGKGATEAAAMHQNQQTKVNHRYGTDHSYKGAACRSESSQAYSPNKCHLVVASVIELPQAQLGAAYWDSQFKSELPQQQGKYQRVSSIPSNATNGLQNSGSKTRGKNFSSHQTSIHDSISNNNQSYINTRNSHLSSHSMSEMISGSVGKQYLQQLGSKAYAKQPKNSNTNNRSYVQQKQQQNHLSNSLINFLNPSAASPSSFDVYATSNLQMETALAQQQRINQFQANSRNTQNQQQQQQQQQDNVSYPQSQSQLQFQQLQQQQQQQQGGYFLRSEEFSPQHKMNNSSGYFSQMLEARIPTESSLTSGSYMKNSNTSFPKFSFAQIKKKPFSKCKQIMKFRRVIKFKRLFLLQVSVKLSFFQLVCAVLLLSSLVFQEE